MFLEYKGKYLEFAISICERIKDRSIDNLDILSFVIVIGTKYSVGLSFGIVKDLRR